MNEKIGRLLDKTGMVAACACAFHCLALPFLLGALPLVGLSFLLEETAERVFIGISIMLAALSLLPAYFREHRRLRAIYLAISGIGLIVLTHLLFEENLLLKFVFTIIGAVLISGAHFLNQRLCRACSVCPHE